MGRTSLSIFFVRCPLHVTVAGLLLGLVLTGCSDTSFVGKRVDNVTAYYNTFYNANRAFDEGQQSVERTETPIDPDRYLPVFPEPPENGGNRKAFEEAIQKSADVLREHPRSKWVDDALLLIGKSYFYQGNDVGAQQKFEEVVLLRSGKEGEARFWLARTLVTSERYDAAASALNAALADDVDFGTWTDRMYLARGELYVRQARWEEAEAALERGLRGDVPSDARARGAYLLGQVRETLGAHAEAVTAYDRSADVNVRYEMTYAARTAAARVQGLHVDATPALGRVQSLIRDGKNIDRVGELLLLQGRILRSGGQMKAARQAYEDLLYDEDNAASDVRGEVHYALATLYRDAFGDFQRAAAHFDTASTSLQAPQQDRAGRPTPSAIVDSRIRAEQFGRLADRSDEVARLDSLLRLGQMPEADFRAFIADLEAQRQAQVEAQREQAQARREAQRFQSRSNELNRRARPQQTSSSARAGGEAGFLFHKDPTRVQEGRRQFERIWGDRPRVPNWRRAAAIQGTSVETASLDSTAASPAPRPGSDAEPAVSGIDVSDVPRTEAAQEEMQAQRAVARYELGNALFLSANRPDSAAVWYRRVLEEDAEYDVARQALYALAEAKYVQGKTREAEQLYRRLLDEYPDSRFAGRARQRLNVQDRQRPSSVQTADARAAYRAAYRTWQSGDLSAAQASMQTVALTHPDTPVVPQALLAAGVIYREQLRDTSAVAAPESLAVFIDTLLARHPDVDMPEVQMPQSKTSEGPPAQARPEAEDAVDTRIATDARVQSRGAPRRAVPSRGAPSRETPQRAAPSRAEGDAARADTSTAAPSDTTQPRPSARSPRRLRPSVVDSMTVPGDTLVAPDDVTPPQSRQRGGGGGDTTQIAAADTNLTSEADSIRTVDPESPALDPMLPLKELLTFLTVAYPDAPQAARAEALLEYVDEQATERSAAKPVESGDKDGSGTKENQGTQDENQAPRRSSDDAPDRETDPRGRN